MTGIDLSPSGSIPAYTGEPLEGRVVGEGERVHSHVHGGASRRRRRRARRWGPFPRTRGSLEAAQEESAEVGSIPAYTGEPLSYFLDGAEPVSWNECNLVHASHPIHKDLAVDLLRLNVQNHHPGLDRSRFIAIDVKGGAR